MVRLRNGTSSGRIGLSALFPNTLDSGEKGGHIHPIKKKPT